MLLILSGGYQSEMTLIALSSTVVYICRIMSRKGLLWTANAINDREVVHV